MQTTKSKLFPEIFEAFEKRKIENELAEISSVFISAKPKNNKCLNVYGANQRMDYKSQACGGDDTRLHSFNGK